MKYFQFGSVGMSAVVLAPRQLTLDEAYIDGGHLCRTVVFLDPQILRAQQPEHRLGGNRRHEAALVVQPPGVALFRHAVADEGEARRTQRNQFVASTGRSPGVLLPKAASDAPYFRKFPAIQWYSPDPVRFSTASPQLRRCSLAPPSPEDPTSASAKRGSNASVTRAALP